MHHLLEVSLTSGDDADMIADQLWALGAVGIEERPTAVVGAFADSDLAGVAAGRLGGRLRVVEDHEGLDAWRAHAVVHRAGPFRIRPPWLPAEPGPELIIDPGPTFGAGSHPSSRLAVELLATTITAGSRLADVGTGSGILAIAAAVLGATCVAVDIDPACEEVTMDNARANGVSERIETRTGTVEAVAGSYDLAAINVTIDLHEQLSRAVIEHVDAPLLVAAGVLAGDQERRCAEAYGRPIVERVTMEEWAALLLGPCLTAETGEAV